MSGVGLHILRAPPTTTDREKQQLAALDKHQRRYLSRRLCWLCDYQLHRTGCATLYGPACDEQVRIERRAKCLTEYKPRPERRASRGRGE